jgi:hypothetical protein
MHFQNIAFDGEDWIRSHRLQTNSTVTPKRSSKVSGPNNIRELLSRETNFSFARRTLLREEILNNRYSQIDNEVGPNCKALNVTAKENQ